MEPWTPTLSVSETDTGCCRLSLQDYVYGEGRTLQEAADHLVAKVLDVALAVRRFGTHFSPLFAPVDPKWIEYLQDLGAYAEQGGDARACVLGHP
jgi:hypothetical protein